MYCVLFVVVSQLLGIIVTLKRDAVLEKSSSALKVNMKKALRHDDVLRTDSLFTAGTLAKVNDLFDKLTLQSHLSKSVKQAPKTSTPDKKGDYR